MTETSGIGSVRRYHLLKRLYARRHDLEEGVHRAAQEEQAGTALPADFPNLSELNDAGYTTVEDLTGAPTSELVEFACISLTEAEHVLEALAEL